MSRSTIVAASLGVVALCVASGAAGEPCRYNTIQLNGLQVDSTTAASQSRIAGNVFNGLGSASYDWTLGTCFARSEAGDGDHGSGNANVVANEDFRVVGLPAGTPLTVRARIRVQASARAADRYGSWTFSTGWLQEAGAGRVEAHTYEGPDFPAYVDRFLTLDISSVAGTPFLLTMGADSFAQQASGEVSVTLTFVNLPPGATIVSCQGYSVSPVVNVRRATWGSLKLRYR